MPDKHLERLRSLGNKFEAALASYAEMCELAGKPLDANAFNAGWVAALAARETAEPSEQIVIEIARELYDRFVMGGWQPQETYSYLREKLSVAKGICPVHSLAQTEPARDERVEVEFARHKFDDNYDELDIHVRRSWFIKGWEARAASPQGEGPRAREFFMQRWGIAPLEDAEVETAIKISSPEHIFKVMEDFAAQATTPPPSGRDEESPEAKIAYLEHELSECRAELEMADQEIADSEKALAAPSGEQCAIRMWLDKFGETARGKVPWSFACTFAEEYADHVTSSLRAELAQVKGAMKADDERLRTQAERAGVLYVGCDTADALADAVLGAESSLVRAREELAQLENMLDGRECWRCGHRISGRDWKSIVSSALPGGVRCPGCHGSIGDWRRHRVKELEEELTKRGSETCEMREERDRLQDWKDSQLKCSADLKLQEIGEELDVQLGADINPAVLPGIRALKAQVRSLTEREAGWQEWRTKLSFIVNSKTYPTFWDDLRALLAAGPAHLQSRTGAKL